jgi:23S rRNA pseudouridine2605 synthase
MRLNRFLASCGLGSRRGCEQLIRDGRVRINGDPCTELSRRVSADDLVTVDSRAVHPAPAQTVALFKTRGLVTSREDEHGRSTIYESLPAHLADLHHAGRLDRDSEGLLILTRDGSLSQRLTRPSAGIEKEYLVTLNHAFDTQHGERLLEGIALEEGTASAASFIHLSPRRLQVVLTQGMKRQLRRMFEELGYQVKKLVRVRIGSMVIGTLKPGRWRALEDSEITLLQRNPVRRPTADGKRGQRPSRRPGRR